MSGRVIAVAAASLIALLSGCSAPSEAREVPTQTLSANGKACLAYEAAQNKLGLLIAKARQDHTIGTTGGDMGTALTAMGSAADRATGSLHDHLAQAVTALPAEPTRLISSSSASIARHTEANQAVKADCADEGQTVTPMDLSQRAG